MIDFDKLKKLFRKSHFTPVKEINQRDWNSVQCNSCNNPDCLFTATLGICKNGKKRFYLVCNDCKQIYRLKKSNKRNKNGKL